MTVGEKCNVATHLTETSNQTIGSVGNLSRQFTIWATVSINVPVRPIHADLRGSFAFVVAVAPLCEIRLVYGRMTQFD